MRGLLYKTSAKLQLCNFNMKNSTLFLLYSEVYIPKGGKHIVSFLGMTLDQL